jgi:hypothetical protein
MRNKIIRTICMIFCILLFNKTLIAEENVKLTALNAMERISQDQKSFGERKAEIKGARNEVVSFQIIAEALKRNEEVKNIKITDLVTNKGERIKSDNLKLFREFDVLVRRSTPRAELPPGLYRDILVPYKNPQTGKPIEPLSMSRKAWGEPWIREGYDVHAIPFTIYKGQNQALWIDVYIPKHVIPGKYKGKVIVINSEGFEKEIPIDLTVWDFILPDGPTHRNHFGHFNKITKFFDVNPGSKKFREIEMKYCKILSSHRINPPIPNNLLPEVNDDGSLKIIPERHARLEKFINNLNVTDFQIPKSPFFKLAVSALTSDYKKISDEQRRKTEIYYSDFYSYLKENGWAKRAYLYMWDEPNSIKNYEQVRAIGEIVHQAVPDIKRLVVEQTYPHDPSWPELDPAIDIWCTLWSFIDRESINKMISKGDEVWSYTAMVQQSPPYHPNYEQLKEYDPPYWHIDRPVIEYRIPTWINWQYNISGLLYWTTIFDVKDQWYHPVFVHKHHYNGGGYLLYPGTRCGVEGPLPSIRLKNIRDGMEDYEYFSILNDLGGRKTLDSIVKKVAPNWWNFTKNPEKVLNAREEIAKEILRLKG